MIYTVRIYKLICPVKGDIRYIGITTKTLKKRLAGHINQSHKKKTHRECWIYSLVKKGLKPNIELLEEFEADLVCIKEGCLWGEYGEREMYWIKHYKDLGCNLVNGTNGGDGIVGFKQPKGIVAKQSKKVDQYSKDGKLLKTWDSLSEAAIGVNGHNGKISGCCRGKRGRRSICGYVWRYSGEPFDSKPIGGQYNSWRKYKVSQYNSDGELLKIWDHAQVAADALKIERTSISIRCRKPVNYLGYYRKPLKGNYFFFTHDQVIIDRFTDDIKNNRLPQNCKEKNCTNKILKKSFNKGYCSKHYELYCEQRRIFKNKNKQHEKESTKKVVSLH